MAEPYLERLAQIVDRLGPVSAENVTLETKHFFSGAALYANGRICASLSPAGFAVKLPAEVRQRLINEHKGKEFRFFAKGPIKREYVALSDSIVQDEGMLQELVDMRVGRISRPWANGLRNARSRGCRQLLSSTRSGEPGTDGLIGRVWPTGRRHSMESRLKQLEILELTRSEADSAAAVLGRGMRDNPLHVRAFGANPDRREAALTRMFEALLRQYMSKGEILGAFSSGTLIGVCGMVEPERCQLTTTEKLRLLPAIVAGSGLGGTVRVLSWTVAWSGQDPKEAHWHLGPVAIERHLQGKGVGTELLREFCSRMDASHSMAYLETDKRENVPFYERFGFQVAAEQQVLGVPNWFMTRSVGK